MSTQTITIVDNPVQRAMVIFDHLDVSETTRMDYKARIGVFLTFIQSSDMNRDVFLQFKRLLASRNDIATSTKNKYLVVAKIFLKELNRQGLLPVDLTQNVRCLTESKKHKLDGLSESEIQCLSAATHQFTPSPANTRLKAILYLLTLQGFRQIEVVRLDVSDIDFVRKCASVLGKGKDDKEIVYLHPDTVQAIKVYLTTNGIAGGALFVSRSNHGKNQRLTTRGLRGIVRRVLKELGITKTVHGFRHYFTTRLIESYKADLLTVAHYTRHRSIETLQIYNDGMKYKADLSRFYRAFSNVQF